MRTLKRRPASGFVQYPKDFVKRIVDGSARFRTKCDMLVGPCACGVVHQEGDAWVKEALSDYAAEFEQLTLAPDDTGVIHMPRYWSPPRGHSDCTVLLGLCPCGKHHTGNEPWIRGLVSRHAAKLVGCIDIPDSVEDSIDDPEPVLDGSGGASSGCDCPACRRRRARSLELGRSEI